MSLNWLKSVLIDEKKNSIIIKLEPKKNTPCYVKTSDSQSYEFISSSSTQEKIIAQGLKIIKKKLKGKTVTRPDGSKFFD